MGWKCLALRFRPGALDLPEVDVPTAQTKHIAFGLGSTSWPSAKVWRSMSIRTVSDYQKLVDPTAVGICRRD